MDSFMKIKEEGTQGYPIAMVIYGIGILPLIKELKVEFPWVTQTWYDYSAGALSTVAKFKLYFNLLKWLGPGRGYYLKPSKIVLIVHLDNIEAVKLFVLSHRFKVCTVTHYLGDFIGYDKAKRD